MDLLTEHFPRFTSFNNNNNKVRKSFLSASVFKKSELATLINSFDEIILRGINSLTLVKSQPLSLAWLSSAVDFISTAHTEAYYLISNLKPSNSSIDDSLSWYFDAVSLKILDLCNSLSSHINRLKRHRLLPVNFSLRLLSDDSSPPKLVRVRDSLSSVNDSVNDDEEKKINSLIKDLSSLLDSAPRGKISSVGVVVRRTINAVGFVTLFVSSVAVSAFGLSKSVAVRVPNEFSWSDSVNSLGSKVNDELNRRVEKEKRNTRILSLEEIDDVESRKKEFSDVIGDGDSVEAEKLSDVVKELKRVTEALAEGLERFGNGVNGMFDAVLSTRNDMLRNLKVFESKKKRYYY